MEGDLDVLELLPKRPDDKDYSKLKVSARKSDHHLVKTEYYDKQGSPYRIYEALEVETVQGHPTVMKSRMTDKKIGGSTEMTYNKVEYDKELPEDVFTERYLRKAPYKYLR